MEKKDNASEKKGFFKKLIDDVTTNVKEGASLVGEKVAEGASFVGEKVAETSAKAYVAGSEIVSDTSEKIHDFTEKQTLHKEEDKIEKRQKELTAIFGELAMNFFIEKEALNKAFLTTEEVVKVTEEHKTNRERLTEITKELKKLENH